MTDFTPLLACGKAVLGTEKTMKYLKQGKLAKIYVTPNCPLLTQHDIERQAPLTQTEIIRLDTPNHELGALCKKPFPINLLGQLR